MSKNYKTELINIGTELLLGDIVNTNASFLSDTLKNHGINVFYHTVVGDNDYRLMDVFKVAQKRANLVIVTGGLGPTEDDLTREVFSKFSHLKLTEHKPTLKKIENYFKQRQEIMPKSNIKQSLVFENSIVFHNEIGMAPGMTVEHKGTTWVFLPGVPSELKHLLLEKVIPFFIDEKNEDEIIQSKVMHFLGVGESKLEAILQSLLKNQTNPSLALLATNKGVILRITAKAKTAEIAQHLLNKKEEEVLRLAHNYYIGDHHTTIFKEAYDLLLKNKLTIAAAESLTGGRFSDFIVQIEDASKVFNGAVVCYAENVKRDCLNVDESILQNDGTVSRKCAEALAKNVAKLLNSSIGISFTGVAGPQAIENKEVGTVWISIYYNGKLQSYEFQFVGNRESIRQQAINQGFQLIIETLK